MALATQLERASAASRGVPAPDYPARVPLVQAGALRRRRAWLGPEAEIAVHAGDTVTAADPVAQVLTTGRAAAIDVVRLLGVPADRVAGSIVRRLGEQVAEGDPLAERRSLGGLQRRALRSPVSGRLSFVSAVTGIAYIDPPAVETPIRAHLAGEVVSVETGAVTILGEGVAFSGIAGAGPAAAGILVAAETPEELPADLSGTVVACGFALDEVTVTRLADAGAGAVVAAGIDEAAVERLGWDDLLWSGRGPAAPRPAPPLTVVLLALTGAAPVPGFWDIMRSLAGRSASALGAEPGAAPELLVAVPASEALAVTRRHLEGSAVGTATGGHLEANEGAQVTRGARVRAIAGRAAGLTGEVLDVAPGTYRLGSEVAAGVATVSFPYGVTLRLPLAHLRLVI